MRIYVLDPLLDHRWEELVARHEKASVFHERGWLAALVGTYGYEPYVLTSTPFGQPLENGIVVCRVSSWMTGSRLVSLPFSDHCEPLLNAGDEPEEFVHWMRDACDLQEWRYVELRPLSGGSPGADGLLPGGSYWFHELDLSPDLPQLFAGLHNNSFQRKIQRAEREGLVYEVGQSEELLAQFYRLLLATRRRHQLLPQPKTWFWNLRDNLGENLLVRVARKGAEPVAAMLTLSHRSTVVYKYGCSDENYHNLGGMPFLFWKLIEESKASGAEKIDLGRTDLDNQGLIAFKDRLGANKKVLTYYRYTRTPKQGVAGLSNSRALRQFFSLLPGAISSAAGRILYRHLG